MIKYNNEYNVDYDKPGFCALCHIIIADFDGFNPNMTPRIIRFHGTARQSYFKLSDGSRMAVMMCEGCLSGFAPEDVGPLMESVIRGWHWEVETLMGFWTDEKKKSHMRVYRKKEIVDRLPNGFSSKEITKVKKPRKNRLNVKDRTHRDLPRKPRRVR